jgi:N-acyl-phosphatidylethanolamine-hydrolysing phospholipase D
MATYDRRADPARRGSFPRAEPAPDRPRAGADALTLTWIGHSTFLIQIGGRNVLTDPVWGDRASPVPYAGPRRVMPPALPLPALPPIDVVLQSHDHYDHLDRDTVRALARGFPEAAWVVPLGLDRWLARQGVRHAHALDWWESRAVGPLTLGCVPAQHFSGRGPRRNRTLWCGWTIAAPDGGPAAYFVGDTGWFPEFGAVAERRGPFDALLIPIGAYDPRWFMRPAHLDPEEAVGVYRELAAAQPGRRLLMTAMHWGTFKLTEEPLGEPPVRARQAWEAAGLPPSHLWIPRHGETRRVRG